MKPGRAALVVLALCFAVVAVTANEVATREAETKRSLNYGGVQSAGGLTYGYVGTSGSGNSCNGMEAINVRLEVLIFLSLT